MDETIEKLATELKLFYLSEHHQNIVAQFKPHEKVCRQTLQHFLDLEIKDRVRRQYERRLHTLRAGLFRPVKDFDWGWPKEIDKEGIMELFKLGFMSEKKNIILLGPEGVGKTMLAKNLAHTAVTQGHSALFTTASQMIMDLKSGEKAGVLRARVQKYVCPKLLVIDELGYMSYDAAGADLMFEIASKRYENSSIILTTNLEFSKWNQIFPNASCITALLDRLTHYCLIYTINAHSYRKKESQEKRPSPKTTKGKKHEPAQ